MERRYGGRHLAAVFPRFRLRSTTTITNNHPAHPPRPKYRTASSVALDGRTNNDISSGPSDGFGLASNIHSQAKSREGAEASPTDNFLEPEDEEYHRVVLPRRPLKPIVIPWPTLLPHHERASSSTSNTSSSHTDLPREPVVYLPSSAKVTLAEMTSKRKQGLVITPCEALSKAVWSRDWEKADQLLNELEDLGIPIRPEEVYLQGAIQQLRGVALLASRRSAWSGFGTGTGSGTGISRPSSESDQIQSAKSLALRYLSHHPILPIHLRLSKPKQNALQTFFTIAMDNTYTTDLEFTERLLRICASKGMLSMTLYTGLFREWCERVETVRGYKVMTELIETACLSMTSSSERYRLQGKGEGEAVGLAPPGMEEMNRVALMGLGSKLRNVHLRTLIYGSTRMLKRIRQVDIAKQPIFENEMSEKQGRDALDLAKNVFVAGSKLGIRWDHRTKRVMVDALRTYDSSDADSSKAHRGKVEKRDDLDFSKYLRDAVIRRRSSTGMAMEEMSITVLAQETRRVVRARAHLPLNNLVEVLAQLEHKGGRESLFRRIRDRFVGPEKFRKVLPWDVTETTRSFWYMAQVTKLKKQSKLGAAIGLYKKQFLWHGLPSLEDLPMIQPVESGEADPSHRKLRPTSHTITGILDAILQNLDPSAGGLHADLHQRYMDVASTTSGTNGDIVMDRTSHLPFVLGMIRSDGPHKTQIYLENLEARGIYPGVPCWTAIASEYAKRGYSRRALAILAAHPLLPKTTSTMSHISSEETSPTSTLAVKPGLKRGTPRMYAAVAAMHYRTGRLWRAKEVIGKMQGQKGPSIKSARLRWVRSRDKASLTRTTTESSL